MVLVEELVAGRLVELVVGRVVLVVADVGTGRVDVDVGRVEEVDVGGVPCQGQWCLPVDRPVEEVDVAAAGAEPRSGAATATPTAPTASAAAETATATARERAAGTAGSSCWVREPFHRENVSPGNGLGGILPGRA